MTQRSRSACVNRTRPVNAGPSGVAPVRAGRKKRAGRWIAARAGRPSQRLKPGGIVNGMTLMRKDQVTMGA